MRECRVLLIASLASLALLVGCGKKETETPVTSTTGTTTTPTEPAPTEPMTPSGYEGWKTVTGKGGTYTIMVPTTYTSSTESPDEIAKIVTALEKTQPALAKTFTETSKNQSLDLYAMDLTEDSAKDGFADNVNIIVEEWAPSGDLATNLEAVGKNTVKTMPSSAPMTTEMVDMAGTKAFKYTGSMVFPGEGGTKLESDLTGYLVPNNGKIYIVSMSTKQGESAKATETFDKIIRSLTFK